MKIGFFTDSYKPYLSGVVKSIELFSTQLEKEGHLVYIFAPNYPKVKASKQIYRFKSFPVFSNPGFRLAIPFSLKLIKEIKRIDLDIIHTHSPFLMGYLAKNLATKLYIPLVFTYHTLYEMYAHYAPLVPKLAREYTVKHCKEYCQACDLIITPSEFVKNKLRDNQVSTMIKTIPTGIELKDYQSSKGGEIREKYGIKPEEKLLLYVGRLGQEKNLPFLIKSFKLLTKKIVKVKLLLVGDGSDKELLQDLCEQLSLQKKVIFTGRQPANMVINYYLASDLFVFPSMSETQGLVILEAMAGGLPVVAVDAAGSTSFIINGENGFLVSAQELDFAEKIFKILTDYSLYQVLKNNAFKTAENYSIVAMTQKLLLVYDELINEYYSVLV